MYTLYNTVTMYSLSYNIAMNAYAWLPSYMSYKCFFESDYNFWCFKIRYVSMKLFLD